MDASEIRRMYEGADAEDLLQWLVEEKVESGQLRCQLSDALKLLRRIYTSVHLPTILAAGVSTALGLKVRD